MIAESERKKLGSVANRRIAYAELHSIIYIGGRYQVLVSIDQIGRFARLVDTVYIVRPESSPSWAKTEYRDRGWYRCSARSRSSNLRIRQY